MRLFSLSVLVFLSACASQRSESMSDYKHKHLALGDSYTIGEAVSKEERWPEQLAARLFADSIRIEPEIIATTGWTTDELLNGIVSENPSGPYDLVSLLIGVNNQYRGYPIDQYEREFKQLLNKAIEFAGGNPYNVFVVSIPDYGVTPFAKEKGLDSEKIAEELHRYNAIAEKIATLRDVRFINITPGSKDAANDPELIAEDGLHPSAKMYERWVDEMYQAVYSQLSSR